MFTVNFAVCKLNRFWLYIFNVTVLVSMGILLGFVPQISRQNSRISLNYYAYAQNYTQQEIANYAKAGYEIELLRQQTYQNIKKTINQTPPNITCNEPRTLSNLPSNVRSVANNYCNSTIQIIRNNNLSVQRFNELKQYYDTGGEFHQQVQRVLLNLQQ